MRCVRPQAYPLQLYPATVKRKESFQNFNSKWHFFLQLWFYENFNRFLMRFFPAIFQVYWCRCHDDDSFANHSLKQSHVQQQPKCNEDTESKNWEGRSQPRQLNKTYLRINSKYIKCIRNINEEKDRRQLQSNWVRFNFLTDCVDSEVDINLPYSVRSDRV